MQAPRSLTRQGTRGPLRDVFVVRCGGAGGRAEAASKRSLLLRRIIILLGTCLVSSLRRGQAINFSKSIAQSEAGSPAAGRKSLLVSHWPDSALGIRGRKVARSIGFA